MVAAILSHTARYTYRIGVTKPFYNHWFVTANYPIGGHHMTYQLPYDLFEYVYYVQTYTPNRIQWEIIHNTDITCIDAVAKDANVEEIEKLVTRRGMWIPNQYTVLLLEEGISSVDIWDWLYGALHQDGTLEYPPLWLIISECISEGM